MFNYFKITLNTFKESVREPIYFLMLLAGLILIGCYPSASLFVFSEQLKLVVDSSMATGLVFGLIIAVLCASHTVTREMRNGTVLLLLSKPVYRWTFIMGKITGIGIAVTIFTLLCNLAAIVSVYIATDQFRFDMALFFGYFGLLIAACAVGMLFNFWRGSSFPEIATYATMLLLPLLALYCVLTQERPTISLADLSCALLLLNFAVIAMSTISVVFATRLDTVANLSICTIIFFLGLVSSYLFQHETDSEFLSTIFAFCYAALPNWQFFWLADAVAVNRPIPFSYVIDSFIYIVLYVILCSLWAVAIFQNKEIAGDGDGRA
ncbi:MAG: ABC transporter permease [Victivallales bacterium]|jgi:ABC-type transport system involved in multi-copper enzyme maturation permease subunit|nr:ABC transporter permease [Victivallales bacterium]